MIYEDICTKKEYEVKGEKKTTWLKCGTLRTTDDGKRFIEINLLPSIPFYVFEKKQKKEQTTGEAWLNED